MDKRIPNFPKSINPEVNRTARLELELVYFEAAVQHVHYYVTGTPPPAI